MKNSLETRLGIFVALAVIAAVLILEIVGGVERFQRGYELRAFFNTIQDLKEGDRIKATLQFEKAGNASVDFVVESIGARRGDHGHQ